MPVRTAYPRAHLTDSMSRRFDEILTLKFLIFLLTSSSAPAKFGSVSCRFHNLSAVTPLCCGCHFLCLCPRSFSHVRVSNSQKTTRIHADRTARGYRNHCDPHWPAPACRPEGS